MSYGIAVKALDRAGGPHRAGGQDFFAVDGAPVVLLGDRIVPHGPVPHANPVMVEGSSWMTLNGILQFTLALGRPDIIPMMGVSIPSLKVPIGDTDWIHAQRHGARFYYAIGDGVQESPVGKRRKASRRVRAIMIS